MKSLLLYKQINYIKDREFVFLNCCKKINRDYNTALNILDEGLKIIGLSSPEFTLVDYPTMDDRLSNEGLKSSDRLKQEVNKEQC